MSPVLIRGNLTVLREFDAGDLDGMLAIAGDDRVTRWLSFDSRDRDQVKTMLDGILERATIQPRTEYYLAIAFPADDRQVVGFARLGLTGVKSCKLGYAVAYDAQNRGYATDACRALAGFGFRELGLHRVSLAIDPDNEASIRVAKRLGCTYEGRIRDHVFTNGAWRDSNLYSVLEHEWPSLRL